LTGRLVVLYALFNCSPYLHQRLTMCWVMISRGVIKQKWRGQNSNWDIWPRQQRNGRAKSIPHNKLIVLHICYISAMHSILESILPLTVNLNLCRHCCINMQCLM